ncbi:MAG: hypothetical protein U1E43_02465 [Rhodospirillales bacterium]
MKRSAKRVKMATVQRFVGTQPGGGSMALKMIADASFDDTQLLAKAVYGMAPAAVHKDGIIRVSSWEQLKQSLKSLRGVDHLIMYFHSTSGGLSIERHVKEFGTLPEFLGEMPQIDEISMEGCNAGDDPKALAALGRVFRAKKIHAFNYFHVTQVVAVQISKNDRVGISERRGVKELLPFFARSQGSAADLQGIDKVLQGTPGTYKLLAEWFREVRDRTPPPPVKLGDLPPKGYKKRSDASERVLQDAPGLPGEDESPVQIFERITIELSAKPAAKQIKAGSKP